MLLPLFPLNTVLFPGMVLPLHIFEQRYRIMIGKCIEEEAPFGVVLIREGPEVGGPARPYDVGTTAYVRDCQRFADGRMNIATVGVSRFRIDEIVGGAPYMQGEVTLLESYVIPSPALAEAEEQVRHLFRQYVHLELAMTDQWSRRVMLPGDAGELSDYVAARLELDKQLKQRLLEELDVGLRLQTETQMLELLLEQFALRLRAYRRQKWGGLGVLS